MAISYTLAKEWVENGWNVSDDIKILLKNLKRKKKRKIDFDMNKLQKEGIDTGIKAMNPVNGKLFQFILQNYILSDYGIRSYYGSTCMMKGTMNLRRNIILK